MIAYFKHKRKQHSLKSEGQRDSSYNSFSSSNSQLNGFSHSNNTWEGCSKSNWVLLARRVNEMQRHLVNPTKHSEPCIYFRLTTQQILHLPLLPLLHLLQAVESFFFSNEGIRITDTSRDWSKERSHKPLHLNMLQINYRTNSTLSSSEQYTGIFQDNLKDNTAHSRHYTWLAIS